MQKIYKAAIALGISMILVAGGLVYVHIRNGTSNSTSQEMNIAWLNQQLVGWKPQYFGCLTFGAFFDRASYWHLEAVYNPLEVQYADLGMLYSANATAIRIDLNYQPWLTNDTQHIEEMSALIQNITSSNKSLIIADSSSESYRHNPIPWNEFKQAWIQRVTTIASAYHPDYYIVVKEPGWYYPMISDRFTNPLVYNATQWIDLTDQLVSAVKSVSPQTRVGVSVAAYDLYNGSQPKGGGLSFSVQFLRGVEQIKNLSSIGFDIYGIPEFYGTLKFLQDYGTGGKKVWIPEAWPFASPGNSSESQIDTEWMTVLYYFALKINASEVMPFYTDQYASYNLTEDSSLTSAQIISLYQYRTPMFYQFRNLSTAYSI